jgi:hypothetical protein
MAISARTDWQLVEDLLTQLASSHAGFAAYRIESYEPGYRIRIAGAASSRWIDIEDIRSCWTTFERLGEIGTADVLEPGRASRFMMALFRQVPGVAEVEDADGASRLTL